MNIRTDIRSFAQLDQDRLVLAYLNQKKDGKFLDIGCGTPILNSSTALLEKEFGWSGVAIDITKQTDNIDWTERPNTTLIIADALSLDYEKICDEYFHNQEIDFFSLDLEPPEISHQLLQKFPFHKNKPKIVAYETDSYRDGGEQRDSETIQFMHSLGYSLRAKLYPRLQHLFLSNCGCQDHIYVRTDILIAETNR